MTHLSELTECEKEIEAFLVTQEYAEAISVCTIMEVEQMMSMVGLRYQIIDKVLLIWSRTYEFSKSSREAGLDYRTYFTRGDGTVSGWKEGRVPLVQKCIILM